MADQKQNLPDAAIGVCVSRWADNSSVLVVRGAGDGPRSKCWVIPGGGVEAGETAEQAMRRELLEETDMVVDECSPAGTLRSPEDGRLVHVFLVLRWHGEHTWLDNWKPPADEIAEVTWRSKHELLTAQVSGPFLPCIELLAAAGILDGKLGSVLAADASHTMGLGVYDVHVPTAGGRYRKATMSALKRRVDGQPNATERLESDLGKHLVGGGRTTRVTAAKRRTIPRGQFAWPEKKKYPVDTAERTRAAASYLVKEHNAGKVPHDVFRRAKGVIRRAAKKFGIKTELADDARTTSAMQAAASGQIEVHARLGKGGRVNVRHMSDDGRQFILHDGDGSVLCRDVRLLSLGAEEDPMLAGVTLKGPSVWKDGSPKKLVWLQLAETGAWKGHPAGEFEMTPATFTEITDNYKRRGLPFAFDMEHASEQRPTEGSIPVTGCPAQGWVHKLDNRGDAGLWGLVEWLTDYIRDGIKGGQFAYLSPAIRFGSKDPVSGKPIGARMTSAAITNSPFLTHMPGLVAASGREADRQAA